MNRRGMTLIELLVCIVLFCVAVNLLTRLFVSGLTLTRRVTGSAQAIRDANEMLTQLRLDIRQAIRMEPSDGSHPWRLWLVRSDGQSVLYRVKDDRLERLIAPGAVELPALLTQAKAKECDTRRFSGTIEQLDMQPVAATTNTIAIDVRLRVGSDKRRGRPPALHLRTAVCSRVEGQP